MRTLKPILMLMTVFSLKALASGGCVDALNDPEAKAILENLSIEAVEGIELPKKDLVRLPMIEGLDPFGRFEEGMTPQEENGLDVEYSDKGLEVWFGGSVFENEVGADDDGYAVEVLNFDSREQRYLVTYATDDGVIEEQFLINVARTQKMAFIWTRERQRKVGLVDWDLLATYGVPAEGQGSASSEEQELPELVEEPAKGLIGEFEEFNGEKFTVELYGLKKTPKLNVKLPKNNGFDHVQFDIPISKLAARHIQNGTLKEIDGLEFKDPNTNNSVSFQSVGTGFGGLELVSITFKDGATGNSYVLEPANIVKPSSGMMPF